MSGAVAQLEYLKSPRPAVSSVFSHPTDRAWMVLALWTLVLPMEIWAGNCFGPDGLLHWCSSGEPTITDEPGSAIVRRLGEPLYPPGQIIPDLYSNSDEGCAVNWPWENRMKVVTKKGQQSEDKVHALSSYEALIIDDKTFSFSCIEVERLQKGLTGIHPLLTWKIRCGPGYTPRYNVQQIVLKPRRPDRFPWNPIKEAIMLPVRRVYCKGSAAHLHELISAHEAQCIEASPRALRQPKLTRTVTMRSGEIEWEEEVAVEAEVSTWTTNDDQKPSMVPHIQLRLKQPSTNFGTPYASSSCASVNDVSEPLLTSIAADCVRKENTQEITWRRRFEPQQIVQACIANLGRSNVELHLDTTIVQTNELDQEVQRHLCIELQYLRC